MKGKAARAAHMPTAFEIVNRSFRRITANETVTAGYSEASTTAVSSRPVWLARMNQRLPATSSHPAIVAQNDGLTWKWQNFFCHRVTAAVTKNAAKRLLSSIRMAEPGPTCFIANE